MLLLTNCQIINSDVCPDIVYYSDEEQKEIIEIIKKNNSNILNKFIIDYYNLREDVRLCQ